MFTYANYSFSENRTEIEPWPELNVPYTIAEVLVAIAAVIGNSLVIVVFTKERRLRRRTKYYIISLAVADLLVGLLGIPFAILASVGLPTHLYLCLFTVSLLVMLCTISIFCLVAVSIDRYWAILHPMSYSRNVRSRTAIGIIIICWLAGAFVGFLPLLGWYERGEDRAEPEVYRKCIFVQVMSYNYLVFLYFATIIIPALLLAAFYAHIYQVVLKQLRQMVMMSPGSIAADDGSPNRSSGVMLRVLGAAQKREVKATQNLSIIVLFFIICWIPLYTINCVKAFCRQCEISSTLTNFCIILSHLNSSFNPFLYAYHLKDFRTAVHNLIFGPSGVSTNNPNSIRADPTLQIHRNDILTTRTTSLASSKSSIQKVNHLSLSSEKIAAPHQNNSTEIIRDLRNHLWTLKELPSTSDDDQSTNKCFAANNSLLLYEEDKTADDAVFVTYSEPKVVKRKSSPKLHVKNRSHSLYSLQDSPPSCSKQSRSLSVCYPLEGPQESLIKEGDDVSLRVWYKKIRTNAASCDDLSRRDLEFVMKVIPTDGEIK